MESFSERMGLREPRTISQVDSLDYETRTALWNVLDVTRELVAKVLRHDREAERRSSPVEWCSGFLR